MPSYIITCPICKKRYKLSLQDNVSLAQKNFTCPNCHYSAPYSAVLPKAAKPVSPRQGMNGVVSSKTEVLHNPTLIANGAGAKARAQLIVQSTGAQFMLTPGVYILGRKSSDSTATLQLAPDIYMSRQHARLVLQLVGGKLMAQVVGIKAVNPVVVNGTPYPMGKPCNLKNGDTLQLGKTRLVFSM